MRIKEAAFIVANQISDIDTRGQALIAAIKAALQAGQIDQPAAHLIGDACQRFETTLNREVK